MRVVISGASGFVGSSLVPELRSRGHQVLRLVRSGEEAGAADAAGWDPGRGELDPAVLDGADAVINLNGRNLAGQRWTERFKRELHASRIDATRTLTTALERAERRPRVLVNASGVSFYGDRGEAAVDESSEPGSGFLADLTRDWEAAALAAPSGVRVVCARLAMIVGRGGVVAKMTPPFRLGLGGPIGSGRQWWPWVDLEDVLGVFRFAIEHESLSGPVNVASPEPVRCREFVRTLAHALHRPAVLPVPGIAVRLAMGEMADEMLLASTKVAPRVLLDAGYEFAVVHLSDAIRRAVA